MNEPIRKVSIITINFNQPKVTEELLASIAATNTYPDIEIIVIDNGSNENPVPAWRVAYPGVKFIRSEKNTGFAGGNNIGIREATGEYLFLVNNDTEFTEGLTATLVATLDAHSRVAMVSPKIRYYHQPGTLQYAGYTPMNYYTGRNECIGQFEKDKGQYDDQTGITAFAHGAAMMVRRDVIGKAGMMKENYFLYYEELDWCDSVKRQGYEIWTNMQALIYHKESVSVGQKSALKEYFMNRNRILFIRRNAGPGKKWIFFLYFIAVVTPRNILAYAGNRQYGFIRQLGRAIWWNLSHEVNSREPGYQV